MINLLGGVYKLSSIRKPGAIGAQGEAFRTGSENYESGHLQVRRFQQKFVGDAIYVLFGIRIAAGVTIVDPLDVTRQRILNLIQSVKIY
jgi:hypothetical protein